MLNNFSKHWTQNNKLQNNCEILESFRKYINSLKDKIEASRVKNKNQQDVADENFKTPKEDLDKAAEAVCIADYKLDKKVDCMATGEPWKLP